MEKFDMRPRNDKAIPPPGRIQRWKTHVIHFVGMCWIQIAVLTLGVLIGMIIWMLVRAPKSANAVSASPVRAQAWEKVSSRLRQDEQKPGQTAERHLQLVKDFFAEKRLHANDFAEDLLGWGSKWAFVKGKLFMDEGKAHQAFIRQAFERHFFTSGDLRNLLQAAVAAHVSDLEGEENALLVAIRADLSEQDLPALQALSALKSDEAFQAEHSKILGQIVPVVGRDLKIAVGREAVVWVGSEIAAAVTVRIASAVAVRLGVSGGILGSGAASGAATLGVGLVVGFVVDGAVDWMLRKAGYDPAGEIAGKASGTLLDIEKMLIDGDPEAHRIYQKLRQLQDNDPFSFVQSECRHAANRLDSGGALGLRHELNRLHQLRVRLREAALKKLIMEGGAS